MILITNDDGYSSPGIVSLFKAAYSVNEEVEVVAPLEQKSASGMATTQRKPMRMEKRYIFGKEIYGISGNPADAVLISLGYLLRDKDVRMILSGINAGPNMGIDAPYTSGTLSAALMGAFHGIRGIAFSMVVEDMFNPSEVMFTAGIPYSAFIVGRLMENGFPDGVDVLNINFPRAINENTRMRVVPLSGKPLYRRKIERIRNSGKTMEFQNILSIDTDLLENRDDDISTVFGDGNISITPINLHGREIDPGETESILGDRMTRSAIHDLLDLREH